MIPMRLANEPPRPGGPAARYELVLADLAVVPVDRELTLGRAADNSVPLADPTVSRRHARIMPGGSGEAPLIEDLHSTYGVRVDGAAVRGQVALHDGASISLGDVRLAVRRVRDEGEAGYTIVVPADAALPGAAPGPTGAGRPTPVSEADRPRMRPGYALKRLEAAEGTRRWVLKDLLTHKIVRLSDEDAALVQLVDGSRTVGALVDAAEREVGAAGPARLARLLAELDRRGLLADSAKPAAPAAAGLARLFRSRQTTWQSAPRLIEVAYSRGAWMLFTRPAVLLIATTITVGAVVFGYLVLGRYGTPFVVAHKVGLGGLVFVLGRLVVAATHELAHGLTMASYGRRVEALGIKLVLVFPYVFVDTSNAWFEPRRRRIATSAAGPACDLLLGGLFAVCCLLVPPGPLRDVMFQLSFGAYYAALFNLNPFLDRDGYHVLVDVLRHPGLRRAALQQLRDRLAGRSNGKRSPLLTRYALLTLAWTALAAGFVGLLSLRYLPLLSALLPRSAAYALIALLWLGLLTPLSLILVPPLLTRLRPRGA
jgi:hypothetical protein